MSFDTVTFWLFLPVAWLAWWGLPFALGKSTMLVLSLVFYGWWNPAYLGLILLSAAVDFSVAPRIAAATASGARRGWLTLSLATNLGLLGVFKYTPFVAREVDTLVGLGLDADAFAHWVVPVGISFYTFQTLSYTLDVYRGRLTPVRSFRDFALYVAFFPQLVAGPIVRASQLLPTLGSKARPRFPSAARLQLGAYRCIEGLFLKVVVADGLAPMVGRVYEGDLAAASTSAVWLATVGFGVQIFADFAGYSGIAIGVAMLLGLRFPENFRGPYISAGLSEFWTRWHITLSSWLRDYLYISLGGNRGGALRTGVNLMVTMLLGGLWHGASWTFVAWGALHGIGLVVERALRRGGRSVRGRPGGFAALLRRVVAIAAVFVFVHVTWVFFRAPTFEVAWDVLGRMLVAPLEGSSGGRAGEWRYAVLFVPVVFLHAALLGREWAGWRPSAYARAVGAGLMLAALVIVERSEAVEFLYFQF